MHSPPVGRFALGRESTLKIFRLGSRPTSVDRARGSSHATAMHRDEERASLLGDTQTRGRRGRGTVAETGASSSTTTTNDDHVQHLLGRERDGVCERNERRWTRAAGALMLFGVVNLGIGTTLTRRANTATPALGESASASCALEPQKTGGLGTCAMDLYEEAGFLSHKPRKEELEYERKLYDCMPTATSSPTVLPRTGEKKSFETESGTSYAWMFVHVPKAAGSFFIEMLKQNKNHEDVDLGHPRVVDYWEDLSTNHWPPLTTFQARAIPLMLWSFRNDKERGAGRYSKAFMEKDYKEGRRMYFTGATAMGMCGTLDAPCAYITVLRDPVERMWSEYTYLCLEGSENHQSWKPEEVAADDGGGCPLNPVEWFTQGRSRSAQLTGLLAPRAGHTQCGAEVAKANLASGCVRYIFQESIEEGSQRIREKLPDLKHLGDDGGNKRFINTQLLSGHNGSGSKLTPRLKARLDSYQADANLVAQMRELVKYDVEVYEYAKEKYDELWNRPLNTC